MIIRGTNDEVGMDDESGMWSGSGADRRWVGPYHLEEEIGGSVVRFALGIPRSVLRPFLIDGTTIATAETFSAVARDLWRRPDGFGGYLVGALLIDRDNARVVFLDDPELDVRMKRSPADDPEAFPMIVDLARDATFMARIQDDEYADAVYASFCNREWRRADGEKHSVSFRRAARNVAELRRRNQSYTDFYPYGGNVAPDAKIMLDVGSDYARIGWHEFRPFEDPETRVEIERRLDEIETRAPGETDRTLDGLVSRYEGSQDMFARITRALHTRRLTDDDRAWFRERMF